MERERDDSGQYTEQVSPERVLNAFDEVDLPVLTASEVAEEIGSSRSAAYNKLETLVDRGKLHKKKVGARAVVYIRMSK